MKVARHPAAVHARQHKDASRGACLACEAVVSKAKDRADSPYAVLLCVKRHRSQHRALSEVRCASRCSTAYHGLASEARSTGGAPQRTFGCRPAAAGFRLVAQTQPAKSVTSLRTARAKTRVRLWKWRWKSFLPQLAMGQVELRRRLLTRC